MIKQGKRTSGNETMSRRQSEKRLIYEISFKYGRTPHSPRMISDNDRYFVTDEWLCWNKYMNQFVHKWCDDGQDVFWFAVKC